MKSIEDYRKAFEKIKNSPRDRVGIAGEFGLYTAGIAAGVASAGTAAATAGATTILGSTTLGGLLGGVLVASTPIGWTIGCALAGTAVVYGAKELYKNGITLDIRKEITLEELRKKIVKLEKETQQIIDRDQKYSKLSEIYIELIDFGVINKELADELLKGIADDAIDIDIAFANAKKLLDDNQTCTTSSDMVKIGCPNCKKINIVPVSGDYTKVNCGKCGDSIFDLWKNTIAAK